MVVIILFVSALAGLTLYRLALATEAWVLERAKRRQTPPPSKRDVV